MKIAICNVQEFNPIIGGIERVSVSIATELIKRGVSVIFVSCRKSKYSKPYELPARQIFLPDPKDYSEANVNTFVGIVNKENIDIILNQNAHSYLFNKLCNKVKIATSCRLVSEYHFCPDMRTRSKQNMVDFRFFDLKNNFINICYDIATRWPFSFFTMYDQKRLFHHLYTISDRVVLLSSRYFETFLHVGRIREGKKLVAINNMLSFQYDSIEASDKRKEIIFVGRFNPQKNPYRILYVWEKLQAKLTDWKLIMVGDGPWFDDVKKLCQKMRLRDVEFVGFADPSSYYKSGSIFWMTSNFEGWPLVLTEAMQYGCVPIAFNSFGSIVDIIENDRNGKLIPPFDIEKFAEETYSLIKKESFEAYSNRAIASMDKFRPEIIIKQWIEVFNDLVEDNKKISIKTTY